MERLLLRPAEAAELLGISRSRIYELIASRVLPTIRVGLSRRIPAEALRRWVEQQIPELAAPRDRDDQESDGGA